MKHTLLFPVVLCTIFAIILFSYRWIFAQRFDPAYLQNWFDHSQWNITQSPRIMGDAELYQLSAYTILTSSDFFHINPETPPFGKYAYGLSLIFLHNGYYASLMFYAVAWILFALLARHIFEEKKSVFLSLFLFTISPIFFSQIGQIGLDLPQLIFLLLHCLFLFTFQSKKSKLLQTLWILFAGLSLGFFTATKIGVYTPLIMLIDAWYLYRRKTLALILPFTASVGIGYIVAYLPYFLEHHSLSEWISAQKWIVHFYLTSHIQSVPFMILLTTLIGVFASWWNQVLYVKEWTLLWPASLILFIKQITERKFWRVHTSLTWQYVALLTLGLLLSNAIIPFWPRYLILILPFLFFFLVLAVSHRKKWMMIIVIFSLIEAIYYLFPQPTEMLSLAEQAWQGGSYEELYNFTDTQTHHDFDRTHFSETLKTVDYNIELQKKIVHIASPYVFPWQSTVQTIATIQDLTTIGTYTYTAPVSLHREANLWKISWQDDDVLPHYVNGAQVSVQKDELHTGMLKTKDNILLSSEKPWPFITLDPSKIADLENTLQAIHPLLSEDTHNETLRIDALVLFPQGAAVSAGFVKPFYQPNLLSQIATRSGITVDQRPTSVFASIISDSRLLSVAQNIEKLHPELNGTQGGKIILKTQDGQPIELFSSPTVNGKDVTLPRTFQEIFVLPFQKK